MTGARRVYVIDDDPQVLDSTAFLLSTLGYECMTFSAADEFLGRAANLPSGCVLTDLRMPVTDGFELASRVGELGLDWPFVMMTSDHSADVARRAARHGIATVLPKPVQAEAMAGALTAAFNALDA
jgi:two-component system response regulator FixJ